jgi:glycosyltransferase involved in cell wall biosynthesis
MRNGKLVVLIGHFGRGGTQRQSYLLVRQLRRHCGLDAEVWSLVRGGHDDEYAKEFEAAGIPIHVLGFDFPQSPVRFIRLVKWAQQLWRVARQLRKNRVRVLLPMTTWPNVVAGLAYRLGGVRLCIWGERSAGAERVPRLEQLAVRQYSRFATNSTGGTEFLTREMRVPLQRISFIPNGVEFPEPDPAANWRTTLGLAPSQLLVVKVANVTVFKDHATLLRAWRIVQDQWTGEQGPMLALPGYLAADTYGQCHKIMQQLHLEPYVRFLGPIVGVGSLLHACDLTVFSSPKEGMPNGVLECMAAGKAIVASDLPGIRDALGPNALDGVLVPPGDANGFAHALLRLLPDKAGRDSLGQANLARIQTEFSVERMTERYLEMIQEAWRPLSSKTQRSMELLQSHDPV